MQIKNRSKTEFLSELVLSAGVGALTGAGIMYAGPALAVAGEQAGFEASFLMGTNALTVSTIPDIVTAGEMTLLATDGAYALNEINTMCTGQNLAVDTVFEGNEENYEACVVALQVFNDGLLDLTTRGYQRSGSGSSSSEAEKSDEGAEISESGVNIRGAGDEGGTSTLNDWVNKIPDLSKQAPIEIPSSATVKVQAKNGYDQVTFKWTENGHNYEVRWHTKTPGAPEGQGNTWVVSRVTPGTPTGQVRTEHILVGDTWIPRYQWQGAISAYRNGTATQEQLQLLKDGHWQAP